MYNKTSILDDVFLCFSNPENMENGALDIIPHDLYMDMLVTYRKRVNMKNHTVTFPCFSMDFADEDSEKNLFEIAKKNTGRMFKPVLYSLEEVVENIPQVSGTRNLLADDSEDYDGHGIFVLTNDDGRFGAVWIMYENVMKDVADKIGRNFYILPSSVHELILLTDYGCSSAEELKNMVVDINKTVVDTTDKLSDSIYYYNSLTYTITKVA